MNSIRTIAKANFLLSAVVLLSWVGYRLWRGLPVNEGNSAHRLGPAWLGDFVGEVSFVYLFFFDKKIGELFVRGFGLVGAFGMFVGAVVTILQTQIYHSPMFGPDPLLWWYAWPSTVACALLGRRKLTASEVERLRLIISRLFGDNL